MRKLGVLLLVLVLLIGTALAWAKDRDRQPPEVGNPTIETVTEGVAGPLAEKALPEPRAASDTRSSASSASAPTFFPNAKLSCSTDLSGPSGCGQLLEPEVTSGPDGTIYVTAQEGVPGGVDLWRRDPGSFNYVQLHKPDQNPVLTSSTGLALGGGDNDIAVSTDGKVYVASLSLVSAGVATSRDRGETFDNNVLAANFVGVDRQWMTTIGPNTVYLAYHDAALAQIWLVKSTDAGATFGPPTPVIPPQLAPQFLNWDQVGAGNVESDIVADPQGRVAMAFLGTSNLVENVTPFEKPHNVYVWITDPSGANPTVHTVYLGPRGTSLQGLFPAIAVDRSGNLYVTWTDLHGVFLSISRDHGSTWSKPVKVSRGARSTSTAFPFIIAGTKGRVGLTWFGTTAASNDDEDAQWKVVYSMTTDALAHKPEWTQVTASDHVVHHGSICMEGIACDAPVGPTSGNRTLAEVVEMGLTKDGRVMIAYPDDSSTSVGWSFVAEQRFGSGLLANVKPRPPALPRSTHGGPVIEPVRKTGSETFYFIGEGAGTGLQDPQGNQIDAPGDVGGLSSKPGTESHVASANVWTTNIGGLPIAFESAPLRTSKILGGKMTVTAFMAEPTAAAIIGTITARLIDVPPTGQPQEIASGGGDYDAGPLAPTKSTYTFDVQKPFEVLKGHRLEVQLLFTCFCSTTMRFYYGGSADPAGFVIDRFVRR